MAKASTFKSVSEAVIGSEVTVKINRASDSYHHRLYYRVGNTDWYRVGLDIGTEAEFTIAKETAKQIPNSSTGTMELCLKTYDGSKQIGENVYKKVAVSVPFYIFPMSTEVTGNNLLDDYYVEDQSTATVKITASGSSEYGGTIKSYSTTVDGKTYKGSKITTDALTAGEKEISVTVTDSRGRTQTIPSGRFPVADVVTVIPYFAPIIRAVRLERQKDAEGKETIIKATVLGEIAAINEKNIVSLPGFNVALNGGEPVRCENVTSIYSADIGAYIVEGTATFTETSTDITYIATVNLKDYFATTTTEAVLPTVDVTMDFHHSGKGVAFGKVAEEADLLDVYWKARFRKGFTVDGDWVDLGLASGFKCYENDKQNQPQYKSIGSVVSIRGALSVDESVHPDGIQTSRNSIQIASGIPEECCPSKNIRVVCQGSDTDRWLCTITTGGNVMLARYGTTDYGKISSNSWLPFNITYLI